MTGQSSYHPRRPSRARIFSRYRLLIICLVLPWVGSCLLYEQPGYLPLTDGGQQQGVTLEPLPTNPPPQDPPAQAGELNIIPLTADPIGLYEMLELEIQTDLSPENPFDPEELEIRVLFTSSSGKTVEIGAFWYREYDYKSLKFVGQPCWKARFTPTETGTWTAVARIPRLGLTGSAIQFEVVKSDRPGFIRVNPANQRYFAFDGGDFFFPIGLNMAWWSGAGDALSDYQKWMDLFAANGGNTIRVWMADWSFGIEWNNTPLGDYSNRLQRAWLLDQIFSMAEDRDIYIILVLLNCADFNDWQTNGWNGNPYNQSRGGPLEKPEQYVTDPIARSLLQRRVNYIVNRWGYSPNLLAWEWWNEVNLAPFSDQTLIPWLQEMTAFLDEHDVNQHLVTNSYAIRDLSPIWSLPEMDIIQKHEYANQVNTATRDLADRAAEDFARLADSAPPKPILLGEFGYDNEVSDQVIDKSGIHLHNGLWATTFAGYAGSGLYWFWDVYIEHYRVWYHFHGLAHFIEGIDLSGYEPFSPLEISGQSHRSGDAVGLGLRGSDLLVWLRSNAYTTQACEEEWGRSGSPSSFHYSPPVVKDQILTLRDIEPGEYTITWYNPQNATWLDPVQLLSDGNQLTIDIPDFKQDLAARISRNP